MKGYVRISLERWYYVLHPRPAYVLAAEARGRVNFMAASWVMPFSEDPPRLVVSLEKESLTRELIVESRVFTVNVYSVEYVDFVYAAGTLKGRRVDKARVLGVEFSRDTETGAPRIVRPRPIGFLEARVYRVLDDLAEDVDLVVADVVAAYADPSLYNQNYGWVLEKAKVLQHAAGKAFTAATRLYIARRHPP